MEIGGTRKRKMNREDKKSEWITERSAVREKRAG
jgi:hypothetical protein